MRRTLVLGDVHGGRDELCALLDRAAYRPGDDRLVLLGDLLDRGPDPVGCVRLARELGAECVLGNHEEKHLRWRRHEERARREPGYRNPMPALGAVRAAENAALTDDDITWLRSLPVCLDLGDDWVAVHAGFEPGRTLGQQRPDRVLRVRWVDERGEAVPLDRGSLEPPPGARQWSAIWRGPVSVVYGHAVHSHAEPRVDRADGGVECWGIDTGCCFGGRLTALILPGCRVVQVPARRTYASPPRSTASRARAQASSAAAGAREA